MCNFNTLDEETKLTIGLFMKKVATTVGGVNFLLSLIEAIRKHPFPLCERKTQIASNNVMISWNKVIFKDKFDLLNGMLLVNKNAHSKEFSLLHEHNAKRKKKLLNLVKTLKPVEFVVKPQNPNDGGGFSFSIFDELDIDNDVAILNPIFLAIFFCSAEFTKKTIRYAS